MTTTPDRFAAALARLDAEIERAESALADLRLKRQGAEAFLTYLRDVDVDDDLAPSRANGGNTGVVRQIIEDNQLVTFTTQQINDLANKSGGTLTPTQISNAITYLRRQHFVEKAPGRRGNWRRAFAAGEPIFTKESGRDDDLSAPPPSALIPRPVPLDADARSG